jgi:outer membrane protein W
MRKLLMMAAVALLPLTAQAQFNLAFRVGYAPAMGDAEEESPLSDLVKSQVPIQVDAMYTVVPDLAVGAYFSYGFGQVDLDGACDIDGVDCSGRSVRLGLQAAYSFSEVSPTFIPWLGAGFGYEWATIKAEYGGFEGEDKADGFEFLNLQAGADFRVNEKFSVGPYMQFSIAQYSSYESSGDVVDPFTGEYLGRFSDSGSIENKGMHEWLGFGIRGKFDL